jgi:membrane protein required for colicin V production
MNWIDLALSVVLLLFGLRGYFRGLFREVFSLLGLFAGFFGAARYAEWLAGAFAPYWSAAPVLLKGIAFVICFFAIYVLFNLTGWLLHRSAKALFLRGVNRFGGVVLGFGKGAALAALAVFFATSTTLVPPSARAQLDRAYLVSPLANLADTLIRFGKAKILVPPSQAGAAAQVRAG